MKINSYSFDALTNTVTISKDFARKASQLNTPEYKTLLQLRSDNPNLKIVMRETAKAQNGSGITFKQMEAFIKQCRDSESRLELYERVKALSKVQRSPYKYVKDWFLTNYANYADEPVFDEDGFVVVKTKAQMEQEAKDAAAEAGEKDANEGVEARGGSIAALATPAEESETANEPVSKAA